MKARTKETVNNVGIHISAYMICESYHIIQEDPFLICLPCNRHCTRDEDAVEDRHTVLPVRRDLISYTGL